MTWVLVTGGAGYVGSVVVRRLLQEGMGVVVIDSLRYGGESLLDVWNHPRFAFHKVDITDADALAGVIRAHPLQAVVHLAAIVGDPACKREPELAWRTNWAASVNLLEQCRAHRVPRFIFASTCSNYGKMASDGYVTEESPLAPVSLYAELKVKFEHALLQDAPHNDTFAPTALRFATVYGLSPRMRFDLTVNEFTKEVALGKELVVYGEQFWRPYCHVSDFANAILGILRADRDKVAYEVFNVGDTAENYTKQMLVDEIRKCLPEARVRYVHQNEDPRDYRVDFGKIKRTLDFSIALRVPDGIREIKEIVQVGAITNPDDGRYYNIPPKA